LDPICIIQIIFNKQLDFVSNYVLYIPKSAPIWTAVGLPLTLGGVLILPTLLRPDPKLLRELPGALPLGVGGGRLA
jgi:hypothetical protein